VEYLDQLIRNNQGKFAPDHNHLLRSLIGYIPVADTIEKFWVDDRNRETDTWVDHREINMAMLATSLIPMGFLGAIQAPIGK
jgi:hypothetical protein